MANWFARNVAKVGGGWQVANNNAAPITGPQATAAIIDGSDVATSTGLVGKYVVTATFLTASSAAYPDGLRVSAYDAVGYANGTATVVNSALIAGGAGAVTVDVFNAIDVILVVDPIAAGIGTEVNMTKAIVPVFV